ncbi:hypothetical protein Lesp02_82060 [Lentzea sp. NBRC 105346]|uniref:carboxylesterase family protein n=1 Tax=Lentzea sp. NBRC 105346 TaxID=3032205 RepID=UPI0024A45A45|nr:carboxylesterase family protein [Lentzea sp. NBRC 105346]GLZ36019.1 hypothetical protein Lesp02_82060 [Lentzea sp. NBRC 105346]
MTAYLGIRYAEPPFGSLRFRAPVPVLDAEPRGTFGPISPQSARLPGAPVWRPGDEDMLTLNVWSTVDSGGPVLLFLHGGANTFGSSAQPEYDGAFLASQGIVVVTCNYRIGFEGYGYVEGAPLNRAFLDVAAVLHWIRTRIASFGGDPGNVTLAGHSSGAQAVACLSSLADKAIVHSMPGRFFTAERARGIARGIDASTPESAVRSGDELTTDVLREPLYQPVAEFPAPEVPLLLCHTTDEDPVLFQEPTRRLGSGFRAVFPGDHGADVPFMFTDSDVSRAWVKFARTGEPGWVASTVCALTGSNSAR